MDSEIITADSIKDKVYTIRGVQVMLDSDLAEIYGYSTKAFNQQVRNNADKFPEDMMFQLTQNDCDSLSRSIFLTSIMQTKGMKGGRTSLPYAFTEQGIYMLMTVLKGELATQQSLALVRMFKRMRQYYVDNSLLFQRLDKVELWQLDADAKFKRIFEKLEEPREKKAVLFFKGQLYDAFSCIAEIIGKAESSLILVDGYVDTATLDLLSKKRRGVAVEVFTNPLRYRTSTDSMVDCK